MVATLLNAHFVQETAASHESLFMRSHQTLPGCAVKKNKTQNQKGGNLQVEEFPEFSKAFKLPDEEVAK